MRHAPPACVPDSYVCYDLETTGVDPCFDQPLQIAAVCTDEGFTLRDGPDWTLNLRCRKLSHVVPSPTAMVKTRVRPTDLDGANLPFHAMMREAADWFAMHGPAVHVGYNSIRFDEPFLRYAWFASLCTPYLTQAHGSTRADAMLIAQTVVALAPESLVVQIGPKGRPSFALGPLCRAGGIGLEEADAHDALHDARATLGLMRLMRDRALDAYAASMALADKNHLPRMIEAALQADIDTVSPGATPDWLSGRNGH